jgi:hypothetical protein
VLQLGNPTLLTKINRFVEQLALPGRRDQRWIAGFAPRPGAKTNLMPIFQQRLEKLPGAVMGSLDLDILDKLWRMIAKE